MDLHEVLRRRRMVRNFAPDAVAPEAVTRMLDVARRAPSAGHTQGLDFLVLEGREQTERFWAVTFTPERRRGFRWQGLFDAPVLVVPFAHRGAYLDRYAETDKAATGLGHDPAAWPVPFWLTDAAMATQNLLLAAVDEGLGALFFGIFAPPARLRAVFGVPDDRQPLGAVALGHPRPDEPGRSAARPRRPLDEVVHRGRW